MVVEIIPTDKATKTQCVEMIEHFAEKHETAKVNRYKERLCEIYDFEQKFMSQAG